MPPMTLPVQAAPSSPEAQLTSTGPAPQLEQATLRHSSKREIAAVIVLATLLSLALWHQAWAQPTTMQIGDSGDGKEYDWFLAWVPYALRHGLNPLFSDYVNYPHGINLMWNTSVLLPSLVVAPFTVLLGPTFSYNLLTTTGPVLSCTFCYIAFNRWATPLPSLTGSLIFAFSPYVVAQSLGHPAQALVFTAPLLLVLFDRLLVVQNGHPRRDGLLLGLLAFAQLLTGEEVLADEVLLAAIVVAVLTALSRRQLRSHLPHAIRGLRSALIAFLLPAGPFLAYQFLGPDRAQNVHSPLLFSTDFLNFFIPTQLTTLTSLPALNTSSRFTFDISETDAYIGLPLLLLLIFIIILARHRQATWLAFSLTAGAGVLSMGPIFHSEGNQTSVHLPFFLLAHIPLLTNLLPARLTSMMFFGIGWLVAIGLSEIRHSSQQRKLFGWALAFMGLVAIAPTIRYPATAVPRLESFTSNAACHKLATVASPTPTPVALVLPELDETALRWQALANFCYRMTTDAGMTGSAAGDLGRFAPTTPIGTPEPLASPDPPMRQALATYLSTHHVAAVIIIPTSPSDPAWQPRDQKQMVAWFTRFLGECPARAGTTDPYYVWRHLPPIAELVTGRLVELRH
jgi:hypothetical protein